MTQRPRTRVKVCGVTRAQDARAAVACGADAIGVIFAESARQLTAEQAAEVLRAVPPGVARIGVFVDPALAEVENAIAACGLTAVQLSGSESPELCDSVSVPVLKAIRIGTDFDSLQTEPFRGHAAALLLDTLVPGKAGGTSQTFDWLAVGVLPGWAPSFVAGGLTPDNVAACILALHPFAVDVSSGVEVSPGVKDHDRIAAFCTAVRDADLEA